MAARPAPRPSRLAAALAVGLLASSALAAPPAPIAPAIPAAPDSEGVLGDAEASLRLVETQYSQRADPTAAQTREHRFGQGQVQYLLGDWRTAAVLFYDLVSDPAFVAGPDYADGLFYLADALYQQGNVIGARLYLRDLLKLESPRFQQALARYLEVNHELGQAAEAEAWVTKARRLSRSGTLSPELSYAYGRALHRSAELPLAERVRRVRELYTPLAATDASPALRLPAAYVLGVLLVEERRLSEAAVHFGEVSGLPVLSERDRKVRELAFLAHGRVLYELGHFDAAVDRYNQVSRASEHYPDALYEIAWAQVKREDAEAARNATELLLLAAPESPLSPQARLLQANLLLKLRRYQEATETYNQVINDYAPVRDELEALLTAHQDPVAYFDELLSKNRKLMDVNLLLPEVARKFATTGAEVANGLRMLGDLEISREELDESRHLATRILGALDERGMEVFPDLQEGYLRTDAVETALLALERQRLLREEALARPLLSSQQQAQLDATARAREAIWQRVQDLPTTLEQVQVRQSRLRQTVRELSARAHTLGVELRSASAVAKALRKWIADTRSTRQPNRKDEEAFLARVAFEETEIELLEAELSKVREALGDEAQRAGHGVGGEQRLKEQLVGLHAQQRALLAEAATSAGPVRDVLNEGGEERLRVAALRQRTAKAKADLREKVVARAARIRGQVLAEQRLLEAHTEALASASGDTRNLVGRIAFDSFQRVHRDFYELVLKADVGVVDVAFTRKQDHTAEIQRIAADKDRALRQLDREFSEVLGEDRP